jgi:hypothetical protein
MLYRVLVMLYSLIYKYIQSYLGVSIPKPKPNPDLFIHNNTLLKTFVTFILLATLAWVSVPVI